MRGWKGQRKRNEEMKKDGNVYATISLGFMMHALMVDGRTVCKVDTLDMILFFRVRLN